MSDGLTDMHRGGGEMRSAAGERITAELREYPEVRWDRFIEYGGMVRVYGWLGRADGRADFLLLDFDATTGALREWITSAHPHPASVVQRLEGDESVECQRAEDHFAIPNAVRLGEKAADEHLERPEVPEEAVIASYMVTGLFGRSWEELSDEERQIERERVETAAPFIRKQERQRVREALLEGDELFEGLCDAIDDGGSTEERVRQRAREVLLFLHRRLDSLEDDK